MDGEFFTHIESILATERLDAYRQDGADEITTLSRYLLNMALCESLYSPLQFAEIALRCMPTSPEPLQLMNGMTPFPQAN